MERGGMKGGERGREGRGVRERLSNTQCRKKWTSWHFHIGQTLPSLCLDRAIRTSGLCTASRISCEAAKQFWPIGFYHTSLQLLSEFRPEIEEKHSLIDPTQSRPVTNVPRCFSKHHLLSLYEASRPSSLLR